MDLPADCNCLPIAEGAAPPACRRIERGAGHAAGTPVAVSPSGLFGEPEVSNMESAIYKLHLQLATLPGPRLVRLPDVDVLVDKRVVVQAAAARSHSLVDDIGQLAATAVCLDRSGVA